MINSSETNGKRAGIGIAVKCRIYIKCAGGPITKVPQPQVSRMCKAFELDGSEGTCSVGVNNKIYYWWRRRFHGIKYSNRISTSTRSCNHQFNIVCTGV